MNINLNEITQKRNQILKIESLKEESKNPRKRSITEINANYLEIGEADKINIDYEKLNKKLDLLNKKLTLIDAKNNLYKRYYLKGVIFLIMIIVILTAVNDYLAITFTNISIR